MASGLGSVTDFITGGENEQAANDLQNVLNQIEAIQTPTAQQLQLGPLQQYAVESTLAPALGTAAQTGPSAFNNENISQVGIQDMQQALAQEQEIANAQGMTPQEKAAIGQAIESVNTNLAGQRGAIAQDFAGRGVPQSLIAAALENQTAGQDAQNAYNAALTAQGQAAQQGLTALANEQTGANTLYNTQANQANTVAAAQNALNEFNTANTQQTNQANTANTQAANVYNTTTQQNVGNANVQASQQRQYQNQVEAPQQATGLALQKGNELAGVGEAQAGQATGVGQQNASIFGGLLGGASQLGSAAILAAEGGEIPEPKLPAINFREGGDVPGLAMVPGDSTMNDTVPARLSPGEFVVPRTDMARPEVRNFLATHVNTPRPPSPHSSDVANVIKALSLLRAGAEA